MVPAGVGKVCVLAAPFELHWRPALADDHEGCPEHGVGEVVFAFGLHHRQHGTTQPPHGFHSAYLAGIALARASKIRPSDGCGGMPVLWRWNGGTISTDLDVIWGMTV